MSSRVRTHIRNNVVGYVALCFAATGIAWAADTAPKNSVVTKSIKRGAVTNPKLAAGAITGDKVAAGTLTAANLAPGSVGTITGVSAGSGLTGGGNSGNVTLSADEAVLQHRLDAGCSSGQAIQSVAQTGASSCEPFIGGSGRAVVVDDDLTTQTTPVTVADFGFLSFELRCSDNGANGTIRLMAEAPPGGDTHVIYSDNGSSTVNANVVNAGMSVQLGQVTDGFGKVSFAVGDAGFPGAGPGTATGTVYLNASFQNSTGTCNGLGFILAS
jgi:hypothetical protein